MSAFRKLLTWLIGASLLIGLYFFDNIRGYFLFLDVCEKEAGLKVHEPLERNVGWTVNGGRIEDAGFPILLDGVAFVRYRSETDGRSYDVYRAPKMKVGDPGYEARPANESLPVRYKYVTRINNEVPGVSRLHLHFTEVTDFKTHRVLIQYTQVTYSKFNQDKTILAAPSGSACPEDAQRTDPKTGKPLPSKVRTALQSAIAR